MADSTVVHLGENSPEKIAYTLMVDVFNAEYREGNRRTRQEILDTYAECLVAVRGFRKWQK